MSVDLLDEPVRRRRVGLPYSELVHHAPLTEPLMLIPPLWAMR